MNPLPQDYSEAGAAAQLAAKRERLVEMLRPFAAPEPEVHASAPIHFRRRAEFRIWHENESTHYLMFGGKDSREPIRLAQFPTASRRINALMEELATELAQIPVLRHRLWQRWRIRLLCDLGGWLIFRQCDRWRCCLASGGAFAPLGLDQRARCIDHQQSARNEPREIAEGVVRERQPILGKWRWNVAGALPFEEA